MESKARENEAREHAAAVAAGETQARAQAAEAARDQAEHRTQIAVLEATVTELRAAEARRVDELETVRGTLDSLRERAAAAEASLRALTARDAAPDSTPDSDAEAYGTGDPTGQSLAGPDLDRSGSAAADVTGADLTGHEVPTAAVPVKRRPRRP